MFYPISSSVENYQNDVRLVPFPPGLQGGFGGLGNFDYKQQKASKVSTSLKKLLHLQK